MKLMLACVGTVEVCGSSPHGPTTFIAIDLTMFSWFSETSISPVIGLGGRCDASFKRAIVRLETFPEVAAKFLTKTGHNKPTPRNPETIEIWDAQRWYREAIEDS